VAKKLGQEVSVDLTTMTEKIPPIGKLEGVELVTEGVHTVNHTLEILRSIKDVSELGTRRDGATMLVRELLYADSIHVLLGRAINPAHLNPNLPEEMGFKSRSVEGIVNLLKERGKEVSQEIH
jgi:hypothetical protein